MKKGQVIAIKPFTVPNWQFKSFTKDNDGVFVDIYDEDKAEDRRLKYHPLHWEQEYLIK